MAALQILRCRKCQEKNSRIKVTKIAAVADAPGRTFAAEVSMPNSDGRLRGGVYANVYIHANDKPNALVIPQSAIVMREDQEQFCD